MRRLLPHLTRWSIPGFAQTSIFALLCIALLTYPQSLSSQNGFSLSADVDGTAGDQGATSLNISAAEQMVSIQIFGSGIQGAAGISILFEYNASWAGYEGFDVGDILPNVQVLME